MQQPKTKGRMFIFLLFSFFIFFGIPAFARAEAPEPPTAELRAKTFVYSGKTQYITLDTLSHPMESEGYYSFAWYKNGEPLMHAGESLPICTVSDSGLYHCKVTFTYDGKTSEAVTETVEIKMEKRSVQIPKIPSMIYSGYRQYPKVYETAEYAVAENGGALEAGTYTVVLSLKDKENTAFALSADTVASADGSEVRVPYEVERAENFFSSPPSVPPCYEGAAVSPSAFARFGEVRYRYYSDAEGLCPIDVPTAGGKYYLQAFVEGSSSVYPLVSALLPFEILPLTVTALRLQSPPSRLSYTAFEALELSGAVLLATMADGSVRRVPTEEISVTYPVGGDCLLAADTHAVLSYGGARLPLPLSVRRAPLSFSCVIWSSDGWVYDGVEREITLSGLPAAVSVSGYKNHRITDAGAHAVSALLSFDRENYEGPASLLHTVLVERQRVPLPALSPAVYNGTLQSPPAVTSPLYEAVLPRALHAGKYAVSLRLYDPKNYAFEGVEGESAAVPFEILPMPLSVVIESVTLRLGESFTLPPYRVVAGAPLATDDIGFAAKESGGKVTYSFENTDYLVTYEGGEVERIWRLPPPIEAAVFLGLCTAVLLVLAVLCLILLFRRAARICPRPQKSETPCTYPLFSADQPRPPEDREYRVEEQAPPPCVSDPLPEQSEEEAPKAGTVEAVDAITADALITDALAEALMMAEEREIVTEGTRRGTVNVDTLSAAFAAGETVDINRLKEKKLLARDIGYYKVLARGSINKPLTVYADDFSLGAIKMIAATGGRTLTVKPRSLP